MFVAADQCFSDRRFPAEDGAIGNDVSMVNNNYKPKQVNVVQDDQQSFGHMDCPIVPGAIAPISKYSTPISKYSASKSNFSVYTSDERAFIETGSEKYDTHIALKVLEIGSVYQVRYLDAKV